MEGSSFSYQGRRGFTLLEVGIVLVIVGILASITFGVIQGGEFRKRGRDATRIAHLKALDGAVALFRKDAPAGFFGNASSVYVSAYDSAATSTLGTDCSSMGLPALSGGYVYVCAASSTYRNTNGRGWLPLSFGSSSLGAPFSVLPIDPSNQADRGFYYTYSYSNGSWAFSANMESDLYKAGGAKDMEGTDGGSQSSRYEFGSNLTLLPDTGEGSSRPISYLGTGSDPSPGTVAPGGSATMANAFTLYVDSGTTSVTQLTLAFSGNPTSTSLIEVVSNDGATVYGSSTNPVASTAVISLSPSLSLTTVSAQYKIRITPKAHSALTAPPGASETISATVTSWSDGNADHSGSDSSPTMTIDNLSPGDIANATGTLGDSQIYLRWTNPTDSDFSDLIIVESTSTLLGVPTEGSNPSLGSVLATNGVVVYSGSGTSTLRSSLTNGENYYYTFFAQDSYGNYSEGVAIGPITPQGLTGRYWIGGSGNWSDTAHWALSSGGAGGASAPSSSDDVYFDANSFSAGGQNVAVDVTSTVRDLIWAGATSTTIFSGSRQLNIAGSLFFIPGVSSTFTGAINFIATSTGKTITLSGVRLSNNTITFNGSGGGWTLQDALNDGATGIITLTLGSLNTNGQAVTAGSFVSSGSTVRTLILGSSTVTLYAAGTPWNFTTVTNLTLDAGSSTIILVTASPSFAGGGRAYYSLVHASSGTATITGANSFYNLTRTGKAITTDALSLAANQNVSGTLTLQGNSAVNRLLVTSNAIGTPYTVTAASTAISYTDFRDITAAGAASPFSGTSLGNALGNTNITFTTPTTRYWVGNGGNWSDTSHWSDSSGGTAGASVPLPHDDVRFDENSFSSPSQTVSTDVQRLGKNIDFTGVLNTPRLAFASLQNQIYGSITLATSGMTFGGSQGLTFYTRSSSTMTNAGLTWLSSITFDIAGGGSMVMQDAFNSTSTVVLTRGLLDANSYNMGMTTFTSTGANVRSIYMGSGTWTLRGTGTVWNLATTGLTLNSGSSTIVMNNPTVTAKTFAGGGATYNNLQITGTGTSTFILTGSNRFWDFTIDTPPKNVSSTALTTQTVNGTFTANGSLGNLITLRSTLASQKFTLNASNTSVSYMAIQNSTGGGAAAPFACGATCVDQGGNSGWTF